MKIKLLFLFTIISLSSISQNKKSLVELTETNESAWEMVKEWINNAEVKVEILTKNKIKAEREIQDSQVTIKSPMGAIIYESGGIIIENGILRILGSGNEKLNRGLMEWNKNKSVFKNETPRFLLIADDVFGGFFAINGGFFSKDYLGKVFYLAPDTLKWENLNLSYSEFLFFCFSKKITDFYADFKWKGFEKDFTISNYDDSFYFYPYLFTEEGKNIDKVSKKLIPISELWISYLDLQSQFSK